MKKCGVVLAVLLTSAFVNAQVTQTFTYTGTIETFTVPPCVTSLTIEAKGAQGGNNPSSTTTSGLGADIMGVISVTSGQVLQILVGQQPSGSNGGGGGSFVVDISNNPLVIAGGGGGSCQGTDSPNKNGQVGTSGGLGAGGGGTGGTAGNGGGVGPYFSSGGGGGLLSDGLDGWTSGTGGKGFANGGAGGTGGANGGFGGGGSGSGYIVGAGGGGYSGGGGGSNSASGGSTGAVGGGGGSYNAGTNQTNLGGVQSGHGQVIISYNNSGLAVNASASNTAGVCPGGSIVLSASSVSTYTWNTGPHTTSISVSPNTTTTYTVYGTNSTGCVSSAVLTVSINAVPSVSVACSKNLVCRGDTATVQAYGASTYSWLAGPMTSTLSISPLIDTSYTVTGTSAVGCTNTAMILVSVDAFQLSSTPDTAVCIGKSILLSASGGNAGSYFWTNNVNGNTSPFQTYQVTPTVPITYSVSGVDPNGCTVSTSFSVGVSPNPTVTATASKTLLCQGESVTLAGFGASTYSWSNNTALQSIVVIPTGDVVFKVKGTDVNGCSATFSLSLKVTICTGIEQQQAATSLSSVFPNPTTGLFTVSFDKLTAPTAIKIYSALGKLVKEQVLSSENSEIDLQQETSGVYFIYFMKGNEKLQVSKIIKE